MKCPNCSGRLKKILFNSQYVDICDGCSGIWFDSGELRDSIDYLLRRRPSELPNSSADLDRSRLDPSNVKELNRKCPRCAHNLQKINYMYDSNVILDKCNICGGLWVDYGEYKRIAIHSKGNPLLDSFGKSVFKTGKTIGKGKAEPIDPIVEFGDLLNSPVRFYFFMPRIIIPLKDNITTNITPYGTFGILIINIIIFLTVFFLDQKMVIFREVGLVPSEVLSGKGYFSFISSLFVHGGPVHLLGNMFFLWIFADNVEEHLGLSEFCAFFLICGFWANIFHILTHAESTAPLIGSSGAISGVMGAYFYLFPQAKIKTIFFYQIVDIPAPIFIGWWIALQFVYASFSFGVNTPVAFIAHIGGFFSGVFFIWLYENKIRPSQ